MLFCGGQTDKHTKAKTTPSADVNNGSIHEQLH